MPQAADSLHARPFSRTPSPDPIFALIEAHRAAYEVLEALPFNSPSEPAADKNETAIADLLVSCRPATIAGAAALCRYILDEAPSLATHAPDGGAPLVLRTLAGALAACADWRPPSRWDGGRDLALLQLGLALEDAWARDRAAIRDLPVGEEGDAALKAQLDETAKIVNAMLALPAHTHIGMMAKARAVLWCHSGNMDELRSQGDATNSRLAFSIVADLLRGQSDPPAPAPAAAKPEPKP